MSGAPHSNVSSCPYILWRLAKHDNRKITGIFYDTDLGGASAADGIAPKPIVAPGLAGSISGTRSTDGPMQATLTGAACAMRFGS
jgi:hypothetical protein